MQRHENRFFSYSRSTTFPFSCMNSKTIKPIENASTQTEFPSKYKFVDNQESFEDEDVILKPESKTVYILALKYVNKFHEVLNKELDKIYENYGDVEEKFTCPRVPNYAAMLPLVFNFAVTSQISSETEKLKNKTITRSNIKLIDLISESKVTPFKSSENVTTPSVNILDYKTNFQDILRTFIPNVVPEKGKPTDISSQKIGTLNAEPVAQDSVLVHLQIQDDSKQVRKKSNLVQTSFNVVAIEPCIDLLEYGRSKEKFKKLGSLPSMENVSVLPRRKLPARPCTVKSYTPKKVKQMFDAISQDSKNYKKLWCNDESDDSIILDDEQFEQQNTIYKPPSIKDFFVYKHSQVKNEKSNPLKLNEKDLTNINEKTLNTIGLFTNRGDIKPDVINLLERQKSLKSNDLRNKQFRSKRQWDLEIHLNPKTDLNNTCTPSLVSDRSFLSYSDIKIHVQNVKSQ